MSVVGSRIQSPIALPGEGSSQPWIPDGISNTTQGFRFDEVDLENLIHGEPRIPQECIDFYWNAKSLRIEGEFSLGGDATFSINEVVMIGTHVVIDRAEPENDEVTGTPVSIDDLLTGYDHETILELSDETGQVNDEDGNDTLKRFDFFLRLSGVGFGDRLGDESYRFTIGSTLSIFMRTPDETDLVGNGSNYDRKVSIFGSRENESAVYGLTETDISLTVDITIEERHEWLD